MGEEKLTCSFADNLRHVEANAGDAAFVGFQYFQSPAAFWMHQDCAGGWDIACDDKGQSAKRIDILVNLGQFGVDGLGQIIQLGAGVGIPDSGFDFDEERFGFFVMLVFDLADNFLDQILDCYQALGA